MPDDEIDGAPDTFHFHRVPDYAAALLGYSAAVLAALPGDVTGAFSGVGNPLRIAPLGTGQTVVDVGCGAGLDLLLAARAVGPTGRNCLNRLAAGLDLAGVDLMGHHLGAVWFPLDDDDFVQG